MTADRVFDVLWSLFVAVVGSVAFFLVISWFGITPSLTGVAVAYGCGWFFGGIGKRS